MMGTRRKLLDFDNGCSRCVFLVGRWAIKVPNFRYEWGHFVNGLLVNMREVELSSRGWPELCPVVWSVPGGWLLIMRRARIMSHHEFLDFDVDAFLNHPDLRLHIEHKADSFGWLEGAVVCVDYGG